MPVQPVLNSSMPAETPESSGLSEQQMQAIARAVTYAAAGALTIFTGVFLLAFPPAGAAALFAGLGVYYGLIGGIVFGPGIFEGSGDLGQRIDSARDRALGGNGPVNQSQGRGPVSPSSQDDAEGSGSGDSKIDSSSRPPLPDKFTSKGKKVRKKRTMAAHKPGQKSLVAQTSGSFQTPMVSKEELNRLFPEYDFERLDEKTRNAFRRMAYHPQRHSEIREALNLNYARIKRPASSGSSPSKGDTASSSQSTESSLNSVEEASKTFDMTDEFLASWGNPEELLPGNASSIVPFSLLPLSLLPESNEQKEITEILEPDLFQNRVELEISGLLDLPVPIVSPGPQPPMLISLQEPEIGSSSPLFSTSIPDLDSSPSVVMVSPDALAPSPSIGQSLEIMPFSRPGSFIDLFSSRDSSLFRQAAQPTPVPSSTSSTSRRLVLQSDSSGDFLGQPRSSEKMEEVIELAESIRRLKVFQELREWHNRSKAKVSNSSSRALEWKPISNPEIGQKPVAKRIQNFAKSLNALSVSQLNPLMRQDPSVLSLSLPLLRREILALEFELPKDTPGEPESSQPFPESTSSISNPIVELPPESKEEKTPLIVESFSLGAKTPEDLPGGEAEEAVILAMPVEKFSELMSKGIFDQAANENFKIENLDDLKRALPYLNVDKMQKNQQDFLLNQKRFGDATKVREYVNRRISTYNAATGRTTPAFYGSYLKPEYKSYMDRLKEEYQARMQSAKPRLREFLSKGSQRK